MSPAASPEPRILYGTAWKEERTEELTALAIDAGFRAIDTANQRKHYFEAAVGAAVAKAIAAGKTTRAELFVQTKFTFRGGQDHRLPYDERAPIAEQVEQSFRSSLEHLSTSYVDAYLLHGPSTRGPLQNDDLAAWAAIEALAESGLARTIGVSNFSAEQLRELLSVCRVKPSFVQNRCYAKTGWDFDVRTQCRQHGIVYQGFSLLTANRRELEAASVKRLMARTGRSSAELVFRMALELGMLPLTGTSSLEHMRLDLAALDQHLDPADVALLERVAG
ncbi:MAG TPA: aldo/keto reductase [Polyangiaceae bacterium]